MKTILSVVCALSIFGAGHVVGAGKPNIGTITKTCETNLRAAHYKKIVNEVNALRKDPKKFDVWYKNMYEKAFGVPGKAGLNTLRDLGTYDPDPAKNQQKAITTAADARKKGTPLKKLEKTATAEQFAEQLSLVHPSNNPVFEAVMKCVHDGRMTKEEVIQPVMADDAATEEVDGAAGSASDNSGVDDLGEVPEVEAEVDSLLTPEVSSY